MLILGLYVTYDKIAKTTGTPFLASNDEVAMEKHMMLLKAMKKRSEEINEEIDETRITVLNLGYYSCSMVENTDAHGEILSYERNIFMNDKIYDIYNKPFEIEKRKEVIYNEEMLKMLKGE